MSAAATVTLNPGMHRKPVPGQRSYNDHPQTLPTSDNFSRPRAPSNSTTPSPVYGSRAPPPQQPGAAMASNISGVQRVPTNSSLPRRSTSSRSIGTASPTSYVALMRKQKATVWCDRAQHEDPRILAKHRADKMRAAMEVAGGRHHSSNRVSTSSSGQAGSIGIRSKIRHPGATRAHAYLGGANMSGAGVPIRLSATEMSDGESDDEHDARFGKRGGSGRSSTGSAARVNGGYVGSNLALGHETNASADYSPAGSMGFVPDEQTPVPNNQSDYFEGSTPDDADDADDEQRFGGIGGLPPSKLKTEQDIRKEEELRRRGSVDDRAMTMTGQRLFVANPDLSD